MKNFRRNRKPIYKQETWDKRLLLFKRRGMSLNRTLIEPVYLCILRDLNKISSMKHFLSNSLIYISIFNMLI